VLRFTDFSLSLVNIPENLRSGNFISLGSRFAAKQSEKMSH